MSQPAVGITTEKLGEDMIRINNRFAARGMYGFGAMPLDADPVPAANAILNVEGELVIKGELTVFDRMVLQIFTDRMTAPVA